MNIITKYWQYISILLLIILLFISRCNSPKPNPQKPIITRDTIWISHTDTVHTKPKLVYTDPKVRIDSIFLPNKDYATLHKQYQDLLTLYFQRNVLKDTLKLDSLGKVYITDTLSKNLISGRVYNYTIKYPKVIETITLPPISRNQLYIGGMLQGNITNPVSQINTGLILKNKKDQLYGISAGINKDGQMIIGVSSYWKISFRK